MHQMTQTLVLTDELLDYLGELFQTVEKEPQVTFGKWLYEMLKWEEKVN